MLWLHNTSENICSNLINFRSASRVSGRPHERSCFPARLVGLHIGCMSTEVTLHSLPHSSYQQRSTP
jgi:hypothetical protein